VRALRPDHRAEQADDLAEAVSSATGVAVIEVPIDHAAAMKQRKQLAGLAE